MDSYTPGNHFCSFIPSIVANLKSITRHDCRFFRSFPVREKKSFYHNSYAQAAKHMGLIPGCLIAFGALVGCGTSPAFDWQGYTKNMTSARIAGSRTSAGAESGSKAPAIFGIGGWEGGDHMKMILKPIAARIKLSESRAIAFKRWPDIMEDIKDHHLNGRPVILIGYSAGCSDALRISNILDRAHVPVGLILIDATYLHSGMFKPTVEGIENVGMIPGNVYMVENYVTPSPFGGRGLAASDLKNPARTKFRNISITGTHLNLLFKKYNDRYAASVRAIMSEYPARYR